MEEFRQLKEALQKMPSFKGGGGAGKGQQQFQVPKEQPMVPANSQLQLARQKVWYSQKTPGRRVLQGFCGFSAWGFELEGTEVVPLEFAVVLSSSQVFPVNQENRPVGNPLASQVSGVQKQADGPLLQGQNLYSNDGPRPQANVLFTHPVPPQDANSLPEAMPAWPARREDGHVIRFTRTMNSLPNGNPVSSAHSLLVLCSPCF